MAKKFSKNPQIGIQKNIERTEKHMAHLRLLNQQATMTQEYRLLKRLGGAIAGRDRDLQPKQVVQITKELKEIWGI